MQAKSVTEIKKAVEAKLLVGDIESKSTAIANYITELLIEQDATKRQLEAIIIMLNAGEKLFANSVKLGIGSLSTTYNISAREMLRAGEGFLGLEYAPSGNAFRWTNAEITPYFKFFIDRSWPLTIRIKIEPGGDERNCECMTVIVDNIVYPLKRESETLLVAKIDVSFDKVSVTRLEWHIPYPCQINANGKTILCGMKFREMSVDSDKPSPELESS